MSTRLSSTALVAAMLVTAAAAALSSGPGFNMTWRTVNGGGGESSGGATAIHGTIGQPDAGPTMRAGVYEINGGFWSAAGAAPTCAGDVDGDQVVDFGDLLAVLAAWGVCPGCPEDLDGNGLVDFQDLLLVLANYGPCE